MITPIYSPWEPGVWQQHLKEAYRDAQTLLTDLHLDPQIACTSQQFSTLVPRPFAARMVQGDRDDPLLRQVLPVSAESETQPAFVLDPLNETNEFTRAPGLIHKYAGRVLLITTPQCAVHCRYCFRRDFPYAEHRPKHLAAAVAVIAQDTSISEVILSGGDPLLLADAGWRELLTTLDNIPHLTRLRIHSRLPIVLPQRVTDDWLAAVRASRLPCTMVIHANHGNELDDDTHRAIDTMRASGMHVLNQSVLLRDVNDSCAVQVDLCERLFAQGALPYYLHVPDRVRGTAHFFISDSQALDVHQQMQEILPGYLLPKLVREVPGETSKRLLSKT